MSPYKPFPNVTVCNHPLLDHHMAVVRDRDTSCERFRAAIKCASQFIFVEAFQSIPVTEVQVDTPLATITSKKLDESLPLILSPILRAGLMFADSALELLPSARVYHIGLYRDEESLTPVTYYNKLPIQLDYAKARVYILDPMLATGGSAVAATRLFRNLGVPENQLTLVCLLAAPEGLEALSRNHPAVQVVCGAVDERLNDKGYIVPGLGDAGDRSFGTF